MQTLTIKCIFAAMLAPLILASCASQSSYVDQHFGEAVNTAKAQQIINSDASLNNDPVTGVDGQAAKGAIDRYQKSFVQPPASTNVFTIGVGSGGSGGTSASGTK